MLAGQMFSWCRLSWHVCGIYLLLHRIGERAVSVFRHTLFWTVAAMLLISLALQFGFQPVMNGLKQQALPLDVMHSAFADRFRMLHGLSSIAYLIQSLLGIFLVIRTRRA